LSGSPSWVTEQAHTNKGDGMMAKGTRPGRRDRIIKPNTKRGRHGESLRTASRKNRVCTVERHGETGPFSFSDNK